MMKAFRHWEHDIESFYGFILENQSEKGWFYELVKQSDDPHRTFVHPEFTRNYPADNLAMTRLEIEADIEYLMVEGAMYIYRVTGDDAWLRDALPRLEKGIGYMTSDPDRWDEAHGLCKRAFTIDTWDFCWQRPGENRRIEPDTPMSLMHGDNSGVWQAMRQLAWMRRRLGDEKKAREWEERADTLRSNMFRWLWNGSFFMHQLHLNHPGADGLERERLSLSNPYDVNRGVTDEAQSMSVIDTYRKRREETDAFAEWFSIDPPYRPAFGNHEAGKYVNGGISPFTAGELAKAAFEHGREAYGWDILQRIAALAERDGTIFFLYDRGGGSRELGGGPSGWGAASVLSAIEEGLAGITDLDVQYRKMGFAPRWAVTEERELRYVTGYELAKVKIDMYLRRNENAMHFRLETPSEEIRCHILLPEGMPCTRVTADGEPVEFSIARKGESRYADFTLCTGSMGRDRFGWTVCHAWEISVEA